MRHESVVGADERPMFARRWCVTGIWRGASCTTLFDLARTGRRMTIYPAAVDTYAVTLDNEGVVALRQAVESGTSRDLPSLTGARTLRVATSGDRASVELAVDAEAPISITYTRDALDELSWALADAVRELGRRP